MYESKFGLTKNPFALSPDVTGIYMTEAHSEALAGLYYAVMRRRGFAVLIGEAGTGKTTLLRKLLASIPSNAVQDSVILNPALTPVEFIGLVLYRFGHTTLPANKAEGLIRLEKVLVSLNQAGKIPLVVVDEAHKLGPELMEEIRLLANYETNEHKLLQVVLAGQPELIDTLNQADLWQLKQRIGVRARLLPLNPKQVREYIVQRWMNAGGKLPTPIEEAVLPLIATASKGIPRIINTICDNALMVAFALKAPAVNRNHVLEAIRDLDLAVGAPAPRVQASPPATATAPPAAAPEPPRSRWTFGLNRWVAG
jgi:general secretion pathway protein A